LTPTPLYRQPSEREKEQIVRWFLEGQGANHIVYMQYARFACGDTVTGIKGKRKIEVLGL